MLCKLCESATEDYGQLQILGSFDARYRRCTQCGFVFVEDPSWLEQAYDLPIAASDTGIVVRNLRLAEIVATLIGLAFPRAQHFLDFGGGAGLFVRLMRDRGFDFYLQDKYCDNVFAIGFQAQPRQTFDLATCLEVIEHLPDPVPTFLELASLAPALVIATELLPAARNRPGEWWYYAPESGQHLSFFSLRSLHVVAEKLQMSVASNGRNLHVFSKMRISPQLVRMVSRRGGRALARAFVRVALRRRRSLTHADAATARTRAQARV